VKEVATADELTDALVSLPVIFSTLPFKSSVTVRLTVRVLLISTSSFSVIMEILLSASASVSSSAVATSFTPFANGNVLKMTGSDSVIKVEADGDLTIQDRNTTTQHTFNPHCKYQFWYIDMWELDKDGSEIVSGGVITGGGGDQNNGGGVLVAGGTLTMAGGSIVGCSARSRGGGVYLGKDSDTGKSGTFIMTSGSIIGCAANKGSIVANTAAPKCYCRACTDCSTAHLKGAVVYYTATIVICDAVVDIRAGSHDECAPRGDIHAAA